MRIIELVSLAVIVSLPFWLLIILGIHLAILHSKEKKADKERLYQQWLTRPRHSPKREKDR